MSSRILIIKSAKGSEKYPLIKDRITLGRDKKCDVFLDDPAISRKHALILNKFGSLYIENLSPTGEMQVDGEAAEIAELNSTTVVQLGPFSLNLAIGSEVSEAKSSTQPPNKPEPLAPVDMSDFVAPEQNESQNQSADNENGKIEEYNPIEENLYNPEPNYGESPPSVDQSSEELNSGDLENSDEIAELSAIESEDEQNKDFDSEQNTAVSALAELQQGEGSLNLSENEGSQSAVGTGNTKLIEGGRAASLKITKGEEIDRVLPLEGNGVEWNVGRGSQNEIQIKSNKISRTHFKIIRIGQAYRIQDLGSSNGTLLNGVAVSDAPLTSYDSIKAGQVEFQFLIGKENSVVTSNSVSTPAITNTALPAIPTMSSMDLGIGSATQAVGAPLPSNSNANTLNGVPTTFSRLGATTGGVSRLALTGFGNTSSTRGAFSSRKSQNTNASSPSRNISIVQKFKDLPASRKFLILLICLICWGAFQKYEENPEFLSGTDPTSSSQLNLPQSVDINSVGDRQPAAIDGVPSSPSPTGQAKPGVDMKDISNDFLNLSTAEQQEIQNLYSRAESAQASKNWDAAFQASSQILKKVKNYKKAGDILLEAQNVLNDDQLGNITQAPAGLEDASMENQDRIEILLESGFKALKESRWDDATESFSKALQLDPENKEAAQGLGKSTAKDAGATIDLADVPSEALVPIEDPMAQARAAQKDYVKGLQTRFQDARNRINRGAFGGALGILKEVDEDLGNQIQASTESSTGRSPASIENEVLGEMKVLQSRVREATETARTQLLAEYQSALADAEEFGRNRQYSQAREIYNRILRNEPYFEDALVARESLDSKAIIEAKNIYQEALIYQSLDSMENAIEGYKKARELLAEIPDPTATEYFRRASERLKRLER